MKQRIWELDVLRGICILGMVIVHLLYDLSDLYGLIALEGNGLFRFLTQWGGVLFLLISGICVTLGSHPVRRGLTVFGAGLLVSLVTFGMYRLAGMERSIIIYFGVLHCLGVCMLLWPLFKSAPVWLLATLGLILTAVGLYIDFSDIYVTSHWLFPLGLTRRDFASSDYFPLMPNLGYFLLGAVLGRLLYPQKRSLLPKVEPRVFPLNFFSFCGRYSLFVYLLHQPLIAGAIELYLMIF